jgi:predicted CXXCH cytochrome family protein
MRRQRRQWTAPVLAACAGFLLVACKAREESFRATPERVVVPATPTSSAAPAPAVNTPEGPPVSPKPRLAPARATAQPQVQPPRPPAESTAPASPPPAAAGTPPPAATPQPAPPTAVVRAASAVADPGGEVAIPQTKVGLTRIGAEKCKLCHKVQYASWSTSAHAKRTPPLECESCHGPGAARAAGLVKPDSSFCGKCHKGKLDPGMLAKAHAHKAAS